MLVHGQRWAFVAGRSKWAARRRVDYFRGWVQVKHVRPVHPCAFFRPDSVVFPYLNRASLSSPPITFRLTAKFGKRTLILCYR
jgi:hypothetical protein